MSDFLSNGACDYATIKKTEAELGISFPASYMEFLRLHNGGEGTSEDNRYICLWKCEDILQYNTDYAIQRYLPKGVVAFGMDGDYGYFFDDREEGEPKIVGCSFGDLDIAELKHEAGSFQEFMQKWI